jgi:uncharacterized surface protein with fasciclin (FAS1) repeats
VTSTLSPTLRLASAVATLALTLTACSDDGGDSGASGSSSPAPTTAGPPPAEATADGPFGPGCAGLPTDGEGSVEAIADQSVAAAAGHIPALSSLVHAVKVAGLTQSLDSQQDVTVLAPANVAFASVPDDALDSLLHDTPRLTALLTHHVIAGRLTPDQLAGTHTTLNNDQVTIEGSGEAFTIAGGGTVTQKVAAVVCGNVQTANATVYVIDQVLLPPA